MHAPLAAFTLFALLTQQSSSCRELTLVLPHELREEESAVLLVSVGVIPRGARIEITTPSGRPLGTISPYGIRAGREAGTYTVPLPANAISGRHVTLRLSLAFNGKHRAPAKKEVKGVRVVVTKE
ncbi:MAG TPA: hypothetical protein VFN10_19170 [Thermoanaerobaculia bacterium]|nr:hypothetical protein [Thermoanaerobaculia bacterium]